MANLAATSNIYFSWSRNISVGSDAADVPKDPVNLVATSSRFGLIFIAGGSELHCTSVTDVQSEHSIDKILSDSTTHVFLKAQTGGIINGVFMSADETTVAVCTENLFCHMFDTRAFFDKTPHPIGPYFTVRLTSSPEVVLKDFAFNPVIPDMFAVVMSDGKVSNYEVAGSNGQFTLKIHGNYAGVKCCSWSPKGKQLVVAKEDGSLVQLKPNLTEAKTIPPPNLQELVNPRPKAIFWASSTVFVVAYWTDRVHVVVTTVNKNAPAQSVLFEEPCLRNLDEEDFARTWFCHVPKWNLLLMVCRNSPDVAVFGHNENCTQWTYYDIEGERAALPMVGKTPTYPTGLCINLSSTAPVEKKNQFSKPPSPMVLLSHTSGCLVPYYLINESASEQINSAPEARNTHGMRRMQNPLPTTPKSQIETPLGASLSKSKINLLKHFEKHEAEHDKTTGASLGPKSTQFSFSQTFSQTPSKPAVLNPVAQSTPMAAATFLGDQPRPFPTLTNQSGVQTTFPKFAVPAPKPQEVPKALSLPASTTAVDPPPAQSVQTSVPAAQMTRKLSPIKLIPKLEPISQAVEEEDSLSQETLSRAFFNELSSLTKELDDLKLRSTKVLALPIGKNEDVTEMRSETKELLTKMESVRTDLKTMKADVHEAEKMIIDALACGTQLKTITVAKDSRISRMDPITQATLKQAQGLAHYLERQLINANNVLDDAHEKYNNEKNTRKHVPTMEMMCRTTLSCDKAIGVLQGELKAVKAKIDNIKRMQSLRERSKEDLTSLADSLLVVGVESEDANGTEKSFNNDQSFDRIKMLKNYLASRPVIQVTPTRLTSEGESMIVSKLSTILEQSRIEIEAEKGANSKNLEKNLKPLNMPRESIGGILGLRPNFESPTTPMKPLAKVTSTPFAKPIIEPISPPVDTKETANPAASSFYQFQNPSSKSPAVSSAFPTLPKTSPEKTILGSQPTAPAKTPMMVALASAPKPFSFNLQKTPEAEAANLTKPKVSFTFEASKNKDPVPQPALSKPSASPASMFTFATQVSTAKTESSAPGTDFTFALKKDPSPSKNFFSPATLGFSLTKKEEALTAATATSPSRADSSTANQTVPESEEPTPVSETGPPESGSSTFSFGDKTKVSTKEPRVGFSFFNAPKASAEKAEEPTASAFKMGVDSAEASFDTAKGAGDEDSKSAKPQPPDPSAAEKSTSSPSPFTVNPMKELEKSPIPSSTTFSATTSSKSSTEALKTAFSFGRDGSASTGFRLSQPSAQAADSSSKVASEAATVPEDASSTVADKEDPVQVPEMAKSATEPAVRGTVVESPAKSQVTDSSAESSEPEPKPKADSASDAEVPAPILSSADSISATTPPTSTSFFAVNKPLNLGGALPSSDNGATPESGGSFFGKSSGSGVLFGKVPSTGLFGASGSATFGQSSAFVSSSGTSFFGGSSTTAASTAVPAATTSSTVSWMSGASQTVPDSTAAQPVTPTSTSAAPLFGSTSSTFGQSPMFGSQTSAFGPTSTPAFPASTAPAFGSVSAFGAPSTAASTTSVFGQATSTPTFDTRPPFAAQQKPQSELFGKPTSQNTGLFGQKSTFGASPVRASLFGGSSSPSSGGFMSGLGTAGLPTTKNVFGGGTFGQNTQSANLFASGGATTFGGQPSYSSATNMGNMAPKESPFAMGSPGGAKPTFGGAPTFGGGSPSGFGSPPTFGSAPVFGSPSAFGSSTQTAAFGNTANTPTFGSLAQNQSPFGNAPTSGGFGTPSPTQGFPAAAATPPKSAAFTQYRG